MLKIRRILRRASQNNCFWYKNSNGYRNFSAGTVQSGKVPWRFYRPRPTGDLQGTLRGPIQKCMVCDLFMKLYFRSKSPRITYLFLPFKGKTKNSNVLKGGVRETSTWDVLGTSMGLQSNMFFIFNSQTH